ncbi:MAG TPA: wax ester/triacylglycerol synthase family O-acyltransferase [Acidimicrobiales bacterium]|nr:wax ester/triacylglycerol synthase family O-acyltransferase [Acidimicrobiales bacterium]
MSDIRFERRMSDMDALMWSIEKDPLLRSTITSIALLDGPIDRDRLLDKVERGTRQIPRLRQRPISAPLALAPPKWVVDPNFDIRYHVRFVSTPGTGSLRDLLDFAAPIAMQGFDRARPLWEFVVVENLDGGRSALIQKIHHAITDGVGAIQLALMLLDMERHPTADPGPLPPEPEPESVATIALMRENLEHETRRQLGIAQRSLRALVSARRDPWGAVKNTADTLGSAVRLLAPATTPLSPIMTGRSLSVRFDTLVAPMGDLKSAAKKADGRLNDAFVAAIVGGLDRYHRVHGAATNALRMSMPINIRDDSTQGLAGNQFVPARFPVPLGIADPVERMRAIRGNVSTARAEPALALTEPIAGVLNRLPTTVTTQAFGSMLKGIDFVTSNVPGVPFQVYLAGARVEANYAFGPLAGAAINTTLLSYLDEVHIGVNVDPAAVPDHDVLLECLREGLDEIVKLA